MDDRDRALVLEIKKRLPADLKSNLRCLIVFGSRVKGEATKFRDFLRTPASMMQTFKDIMLFCELAHKY